MNVPVQDLARAAAAFNVERWIAGGRVRLHQVPAVCLALKQEGAPTNRGSLSHLKHQGSTGRKRRRCRRYDMRKHDAQQLLHAERKQLFGSTLQRSARKRAGVTTQGAAGTSDHRRPLCRAGRCAPDRATHSSSAPSWCLSHSTRLLTELLRNSRFRNHGLHIGERDTDSAVGRHQGTSSRLKSNAPPRRCASMSRTVHCFRTQLWRSSRAAASYAAPSPTLRP